MARSVRVNEPRLSDRPSAGPYHIHAPSAAVRTGVGAFPIQKLQDSDSGLVAWGSDLTRLARARDSYTKKRDSYHEVS